MRVGAKLSHTSAMILKAISAGYVYGFCLMEMTGLPSGTVYPALRRLERVGLIRPQWEGQGITLIEQRPPRKFYKLTERGETVLDALLKRYPLLEKLIPNSKMEVEQR